MSAAATGPSGPESQALSAERLTEIAARLDAVASAPWVLRDDLEGDGYPGHLWVVRTPDAGHEEPDDQAVVISIGDRSIGELVESAPADLRALLADNERLRDRITELEAGIAWRDAERDRWAGVHYLVERAINKGLGGIDTVHLEDTLGPEPTVPSEAGGGAS